MSVRDEIVLDVERAARIGLDEAIFCAGKSAAQIDEVLTTAAERGLAALLLTRLDPDKRAALASTNSARLDYDPVSRTAVFGTPRTIAAFGRVAVVCAGTSDVPVAREALRTLAYHGEEATLIADVGVAGLWRLTAQLDELRRHPILIVAAGMDAALPSVIGGLHGGAIVAVPTSVGYGVAAGGHTALNAILASCASGLSVVNIDNGYGAACAALRILHAFGRLASPEAP